MGAEAYQVPLNEFCAILATEEQNVPFGYLLWGEGLFQRPMVVPSAVRSGIASSVISSSVSSQPLRIGRCGVSRERGFTREGVTGAPRASRLLVYMGRPTFRPDPTLRDMIRRVRIEPPTGFAHGALGSAADAPSGSFWMVWCIGTFGPFLSWYGLMCAGAQVDALPWLFWIGVILLSFNCCVAVITGGYEEGGLAGFGYGPALLAGRAMIVIVTVVLLVFILTAWGVIQVTVQSNRQ